MAKGTMAHKHKFLKDKVNFHSKNCQLTFIFWCYFLSFLKISLLIGREKKKVERIGTEGTETMASLWELESRGN